jgi:hypothetical protein
LMPALPPVAGQGKRPRKSHRRGNDALTRGLAPQNDRARGSLGQSRSNRPIARGGVDEPWNGPGFRRRANADDENAVRREVRHERPPGESGTMPP